jgi:hypothetical protein
MKLTATAIFLGLAAWLCAALWSNNRALDQWEASQNDVKRSYELLNAARQKHRQMAKNTKHGAEQLPGAPSIPAREVRVQ